MSDFIGTTVTSDSVSINANSNAYVSSSSDIFMLPAIISPERQAFILMKVLCNRRLTDKEKSSLPAVMECVAPIIGEAESKILLKHIQDGEMIFKDEDLLESCIAALSEDMDACPHLTYTQDHSGPLYSAADGHLEFDAYREGATWCDSTGEVYTATQANNRLEINTTADDHGIEKIETSGTIGEQ